MAHRMFGRLPLAQVLEPAVAAAEAGIEVTWQLQLPIGDRLAANPRAPPTPPPGCSVTACRQRPRASSAAATGSMAPTLAKGR